MYKDEAGTMNILLKIIVEIEQITVNIPNLDTQYILVLP